MKSADSTVLRGPCASRMRRMLRYWCLAISLLAAPAFAAQLNLAWDASTGPGVAGYYVYYGQASHSYTTRLDAGNQTTFTVSGLTGGLTYFFAVTAYDSARNESALSNEATATVPASPPASTALASSPNPAIFGASVTFTATVTGTAPTGTVTFTADGTTISGCSAAALTGTGNVRTAACTTAGLTVGTRSIVARYNGDAQNGASSSPSLAQVINNASPGITLASSANPSTFGSIVSFTATVTGVAPTGPVNFTAGGTSISGCGAVNLGGSGNSRTATCAVNTLAVGTHNVVASYAGNANNAPATSPSLAQVVNKATTTTGVASSINPSTVGGNVTFTATVTGNGPTGAVGFTRGGASISGCSAVNLAGSGNTRTATCAVNTLPAGTHSIVASYVGNATNAASTSPTLTQVVNGTSSVATTTSLVSSVNPSTSGANVTLTATVAGSSPTGTVAFTADGNSIFGCTAVSLAGSGNARTATCTSARLTQGVSALVARYGGNATNLASSSAALAQSIEGGLTADFNGDGKDDLVWHHQATGQTSMWLMNGAAFAPGSAMLLMDPRWLPALTGDFNGDGKADLVWRNEQTGETAIWLMNGSQMLGGAVILADPRWRAVRVADLNGDGKSDLIWKETAGAGAIAVWLMNGLQYVASANVAASGAVTHVGDLNGDGKDDLILRINDVTYAYLMNGQTIASATQLATGANRAVIEVGDFNGDGRTDLVWHDFATGSTSIALMNGAATLSSAVVLTSADWFVTGAGEFNADGKADLLWRNRATGEVAIWLMDGTRFNGGATLLADPNWRVAKVGNFNGDVGAGGRPKHDLLWRNLATGDHAVWLMNGSAFAGGAIVLNGANWWALP